MDRNSQSINEIYHDILFGLNGIKSSCIYEYQTYLKELLTDSEMALLERISDIGLSYCEIKSFIDDKNNDDTCGFYILKCVEKIDKCLEMYTSTILKLEAEPACLSNLYSQIYPYSEVMMGILKLVQDLKISGSKGSAVLETLEKHLQNSARASQVALQFIFQGVSQIMLNHLQSWFLYGEITDTSREFFIQKNQAADSNNPFYCWCLHFALVPSFVSPAIAEKILNIGQTVLFLKSRPNKKFDASIKEMCIDETGITGKHSRDVIDQFKVAAAAAPVQQWKLVEEITQHVACLATTQLHYLAMEDGGLIHQLNNIKDVFLMGRGELFHEFVTQTDIKHSKTFSPFLDLNLLLEACARKVLIKEEMLKLFSLELIDGENGPRYMIQYKVPWPLQLIFTQHILESYNNIFRFLLRLKRIQVRMVAAWLRDKCKRRLVSCAKRRQLQQNLWFLVNNLQYYLQVDVLESQFVTLQSAVLASGNFDDVRMAHTRFLSNLSVQSFLDNGLDTTEIANPVQQRLNNILMLCEEFCSLAERHVDDEMPADFVDCLTYKFDACFQRLFALLGALKKHASHPGCQHLGQLLLRLDFNRYFSLSSNSDATVIRT